MYVGGPDDVPLAQALVAAGPPGGSGRVAAGRFGPAGAPARLLARCRALVSGDTGVMHMATGVGTPVVALFGPTVRSVRLLPLHRSSRRGGQLDLDCRPCSTQGGRTCPLGHHRCLVDLAPATVFEALRAELA